MRVVQDEKQLSHEQYLMIRKVHCAFVEHCIDNYGIVPPANYTDLRNETFLYYKYANRAEEYVENELGISAYACAKDGGRFPVFECVNCGEEQLAYDEEHNKDHFSSLEQAAKYAYINRLPKRADITDGLPSEVLLDLLVQLYNPQACKLAVRTILRQNDNNEIKG